MDELFHSILGKVMFITKHSVANMVVDGNQATIVWHVNNKVVDSALAEIVKHFGALSIPQGEKHTYVGMDFELPGDGSFIIMAKDYILEAVHHFGEDVSSGAITPASNIHFVHMNDGNLFSI